MIIDDFYRKIPTWDNGTWTDTEFTDKDEFISFVESVFKEPGKMELDETTEFFNEQARRYKKNQVYCIYPKNTKSYVDYWDAEKDKCRNGVIFRNGDKVWYLPREYYMWVNFLPIYDKIKNNFDFPNVWDVQIYMALYELLAELKGKHAVIVKKRQIASSYYHGAKLINTFWFEEGANLKMGASQKDKIDTSGTWKYLEEYRNFLNTNTAWVRPLNPSKIGDWCQKTEIKKNGRVITIGLKSTLIAKSFEKSPSAGVGGPTKYFFYEEAGIAPTLDKTYIYMKSAMEMGDIKTGTFIAAGSVGELKDCEPLKKLVLNPEVNDFLGVETDLCDSKGSRGIRGLFIPEQWGMPPYIDDYGNSQVEDALNALNIRFEETKKKKSASDYQLEISQHPRNIEEAFAYREESKFPLGLLETQQLDIQDNYFPYELVDLKKDIHGTLLVNRSTKIPIDTWPVSMTMEDKTGSIQVWERPDKNATFGTYIASVDPVTVGKSETSDSLACIYVYKKAKIVKKQTSTGEVSFVEGDKIVCAWTGRYDNLDDTFKRISYIIEWYNAYTLVENNVNTFVLYMIKEKKQKYLVPRDQMLFLKETNANRSVYREYGYTRTKELWNRMFPMFIDWISEVVDEEFDELGQSVKKYYGIRRIPDIMAIKEMFGYNDSVNTDRLSALIPLIAFVKIQEANIPIHVENEQDKNFENSKNLYKLDKGGLGLVGQRNKMFGSTNRKNLFNPFVNIR